MRFVNQHTEGNAESTGGEEPAQIRWLMLLLGILCIALIASAIGFLYRDDIESGWTQAIAGVLVNVASTLIVGFVAYILFVRKGIAFPTARNIAKEVTTMALDNVDNKLHESGVKDFFPSFRSVDWASLIGSSSRIDIAVYYFDSWVRANWDSLEDFFSRGGTINIYLPAPDSKEVLDSVSSLFPEHTREAVKQKIENTKTRFEAVLAGSKSLSGQVNVYHLDRPAQYSAIRLDQTSVVLSVYENYRESKIDSSALILDLSLDNGLKAYWDKEFGGMHRNGRRAL